MGSQTSLHLVSQGFRNLSEQLLSQHPAKKITPGQAGVRVGGQHGVMLYARGPQQSQGSP